MDGFEAYANIIKSQHNEMLEARKTYIKEMYKILIYSGFKRPQAVEHIYNTLVNRFNSITEANKIVIENVTREIK